MLEMSDVAADSARPRAKWEPGSLIGPFFPVGSFDWLKFRALFE